MERRTIFLYGKPQSGSLWQGVLQEPSLHRQSLASAPTQCLLTPVSHPVSLSAGEMKAALLQF